MLIQLCFQGCEKQDEGESLTFSLMLERSIGTEEDKKLVGQINTKPELFLDIKTCLLKLEILVTLANRILHILYRLDQEYLVKKYLVFLF